MSTSNDAPEFLAAANALAEAQDVDVLLLNSPIGRPLDDQVIDLCCERRRRRGLCLLLVTEGGDPDAAYRLARWLQDAYKKFTVFVSGYCKSAGTLIALGAQELVICDHGELGPLDVQMFKEDELGETMSGLTATAALSTLHPQAFKAFEYFLLETKRRSAGSITTRTATQVAVNLTCGLFAPIYGHVDPMHVGEAGRALLIAQRYGERLQSKSQNFTPDTLRRLTTQYPSHGFTIDRAEAETLFTSVRAPNELEKVLAAALGSSARIPVPDNKKLVAFLSDEQPAAALRIEAPSTAEGQDGNNPEGSNDSVEPSVAEVRGSQDPGANAPDSGAPPE